MLFIKRFYWDFISAFLLVVVLACAGRLLAEPVPSDHSENEMSFKAALISGRGNIVGGHLTFTQKFLLANLASKKLLPERLENASSAENVVVGYGYTDNGDLIIFAWRENRDFEKRPTETRTLREWVSDRLDQKFWDVKTEQDFEDWKSLRAQLLGPLIDQKNSVEATVSRQYFMGSDSLLKLTRTAISDIQITEEMTYVIIERPASQPTLLSSTGAGTQPAN